jgi:hypothetical protein
MTWLQLRRTLHVTQLQLLECGASLAALSLPFNRVDECRQCKAALHACKLCEFYDVAVAKHCREPIAEEVRDKERANFCDYFTPRVIIHSSKSQDDVSRAQAQLDQLFGSPAQPAAGSADVTAASAADEARRKLEALFGSK